MCEPGFARRGRPYGGAMTPDELDRILRSEDLLEPSSGFATNVMDAVRRQLAEPLAPRFPWIRFASGLLAGGVMALTGTILLSQSEVTVVALAPLGAIVPEIGYATAVLLMSFGLTSLP